MCTGKPKGKRSQVKNQQKEQLEAKGQKKPSRETHQEAEEYRRATPTSFGPKTVAAHPLQSVAPHPPNPPSRASRQTH